MDGWLACAGAVVGASETASDVAYTLGERYGFARLPYKHTSSVHTIIAPVQLLESLFSSSSLTCNYGFLFPLDLLGFV